jgi:membrane dipeptidase
VTRLHVVPFAALLAAAAACGPRTATVSTAATPEVSERALRLYRDAIVVDAHNDMPTKMIEDGYDPDVRHAPGTARDQGETDLPRLVESGITGQFFSAWVDAPFARRQPDASYERALEYVDSIRTFVARHPDRLTLATSAEDVRRAKREGKIAALIGVEGGHAIEASLDKLRELHRRGVRYLTLTWNNGNQWAGSSIGVDGTRTAGLTDFGREVVREMNRLGMLVDVSHVSEATFADAVAASSRPVVASHSSARALADHPRNLTDDQLRAVARNGGVVAVNFYAAFLDARYFAAKDSLERALGDAARPRVHALPRPSLSVLIDHIDHIARVAGKDHVGLGSDFDGVGGLLPEGMEDVTRLPRIVQALLDRGWSDDDVRKFLGGNLLRVMEASLR